MTKPLYNDKDPYIKEAKARIEARAAKYVEESTLAKEQTKHDEAYNAACLFEILHRLTLEKLAGIGRSEETRTITSVAGAYHRAIKELGVTEERIDSEDDEL